MYRAGTAAIFPVDDCSHGYVTMRWPLEHHEESGFPRLMRSALYCISFDISHCNVYCGLDCNGGGRPDGDVCLVNSVLRQEPFCFELNLPTLVACVAITWTRQDDFSWTFNWSLVFLNHQSALYLTLIHTTVKLQLQWLTESSCYRWGRRSYIHPTTN